MSILLIVLTLVMSLAVGWSIGANDAANSLGTAVGSRVITLKQGIILITVFGLMGAVFQGSHVVHTIGRGIIPMHLLESGVSTWVALVASFAACAWVVIATFWKMPISTSHSIVGAVAGAGLAIGAPVKWKILCDIFLCWIFTPVGSVILGYVFLVIAQNIFYRFVPRKYMRGILTFLIVVSGCYVAYTWGANDVANATGVIAGAGILSPKISILLGGLAIVVGIMTWGYKVIETIGAEITHLVPLMAFTAQLASAVNVHIYTVFGIPVSTSHSIVGAIFGVGLVKGVRVVNLRILREIVFCWLATPFVSGVISFFMLKAIGAILKW